MDALVGLTTTGDDVYANPAYVIPSGDLPALRVYVVSETVDDGVSEMGDHSWREIEARVEAVARTSSADLTVLDVLDTSCVEVEAALMGDSALGALVYDLRLTGTTIEIDGEAEEPTGVATMTWVMAYGASRSNPTTVTT